MKVVRIYRVLEGGEASDVEKTVVVPKGALFRETVTDGITRYAHSTDEGESWDTGMLGYFVKHVNLVREVTYEAP